MSLQAQTRYWFDCDINSGGTLTGTTITSNVDVSKLRTGLHALHIQTVDDKDKPSSTQTRWFVIACDETLTGSTDQSHRYWFDSDVKSGGTLTGNSIATNVDVSKLRTGLHALHIQTVDDKNKPSSTQTRWFMIAPIENFAAMDKYRCATWIDGAFHSMDEVTCEDGRIFFKLDVNSIKPGKHELCAVLLTADGRMSDRQTAYFMRESFSLIIAAGETYICDEELAVSTLGMENNEAEGLYAALLNTGTMSADSVWVSDIMPSNEWTFVTLPFAVKMGDIVHDNASVQYAIRRYDGAGRAQNGIANATEGGTVSNWKRVRPDETLAAGEGFILQHNAMSGSERFVFPASDNINAIFATEDVVVPLQEHPSAYRCNAGWNLIGNPYPCYYDMSHSDFTAPVTIWNGEGYDAYRPHDDEVVLHPFEAFFVQRQDREAITFTAQAPSPVPPRGKAVTNDSDKRTGTEYSGLRTGTRQSSIPFSGTRTLINLSVHALPHGEGRGGGCRIVLNDLSSCDYEPECDAAKFFGGSIDLYTIEGGTAYAINERPLGDGVVALGFSCAKAGTYTITADRPVVLVDKQLGTTAVLGIDDGGYAADGTSTLSSYTFTASAGNTASRFELRLGEVTSIATVPGTRDDAWCTMSGVRLSRCPAQRGIYIRGGRKVAR